MGENSRNQVVFQCPQSLRSFLEEKAKAEGRSLSNYIRRALTEHVKSLGYVEPEMDFTHDA